MAPLEAMLERGRPLLPPMRADGSMKIVVGSSDLQLSLDVIGQVAAAFAAAPPDEAFAVRVPYDESEPPSAVERLVEGMADRFGRQVIRFSPTRGGRAAVFHRDYDMMFDASEVLAFFSPERDMDGGTGHVVKAALDRGVKVDAYGTRPDGTLVFLGSEEAAPRATDGNDVLAKMWREAHGA
jgi:hypothetical protein